MSGQWWRRCSLCSIAEEAILLAGTLRTCRWRQLSRRRCSRKSIWLIHGWSMTRRLRITAWSTISRSSSFEARRNEIKYIGGIGRNYYIEQKKKKGVCCSFCEVWNLCCRVSFADIVWLLGSVDFEEVLLEKANGFLIFPGKLLDLFNLEERGLTYLEKE